MTDPSLALDRPGDAWDDVIGQDGSVALLRSAAAGDSAHAWLFVGPSGSGKRAAARAFAGDLLAAPLDAAGDPEGAARTRALARSEQHPDLWVVEREGASISSAQAEQIVHRASRTPVEGSRKVLVLDEFHLIAPDVAPKLLKTIEEPPVGTTFVVLADQIPPDLITIASRCVQLDFSAVGADAIAARLEQEGIAPERAAAGAASAGGDLDRARLLATDDRLALRVDAWRDAPRRIDGRGATAAVVVDDLRAAIDDAEGPLKARQAHEVAEMEARVERYGQRGSGKKALEDRHKRESRRLRADELRLGLATLAGVYRDEMVVAADPTSCMRSLEAIQDAYEAMTYNPNEQLLLVAMFLRLEPLN